MRRPGSSTLVRQDHVVEIVCYQLMLNDLKLTCTGAGILPPQVSLMHRTIVSGEYFLQVDAIKNIGSTSSRQPADGLDDDPFLEPVVTDVQAGWGRMFKLLLTDGVQYVPAVEFKPIPALHVGLAVGTTKLLVRDARVRRGVLHLIPANTTVLDAGPL